MKVFRFGTFYNYDTVNADSSWNKEQVFKAASFYATCIHLGYAEQLSYSLSYMFIRCESVPGTKYEKSYMDMLNKIMDRVEIT